MRAAFGKAKARLATGIGSTIAVGTATVYTIMGAGASAPVAQYDAGAPIEAGQWQVAAQRAWISTEKVYGVTPRPGQKALVLEADLSNRTRVSSRDYAKLFNPHPKPGVKLEPPVVTQLRDPQIGPLMHPGLGERVAFVWMMPDTAASPATLELDVVAQTFKPIDNLYGTPGWFNPKVVGQVELPVQGAAEPRPPAAGQGL
ncbi:hypothetical protein [Bordetella petrii]|uniref:hypothetical protein n=1 Tax=Bordetella petrii TaxID=94624 RepID=UPI001E32D1FB|nr:hypothetical protein [Bordetella petrii]MCD0502695.1 hypothetical protein [Bordetella petrii]